MKSSIWKFQEKPKAGYLLITRVRRSHFRVFCTCPALSVALNVHGVQFWAWSGVLSLRWGGPRRSRDLGIFCGEDRQHSVDSQRSETIGFKTFLNTMQEEHGCSSHIAKSSDENMAYVIHNRIPSSLLPILTHALHYNAISLIFIFFFMSWFFKRVLQLNGMSNKQIL